MEFMKICNGLLETGVTLKGRLMNTDGEKMPTIFIKLTEGHGIGLKMDKIMKAADVYEMTVDEVVKEIMGAINKYICMKINNSESFTREYVLEHLRMGLRYEREYDGSISKKCKDFEGLEEYVYLYDADIAKFWSFSIHENNFECLGISKDEALEVARKNTFAETSIVSMASLMELYNGSEFVTDEDSVDAMFIVTNENKWNGASAILDRKALERFAKMRHIKKMVVFPSSIHEVIVMDGSNIDEEYATHMVNAVNDNCVKADEVLGDRAYFLEF